MDSAHDGFRRVGGGMVCEALDLMSGMLGCVLDIVLLIMNGWYNGDGCIAACMICVST